ncbi:cytochrome-c peroxidase [Trichloromonas sp.]|uniref:cytochrome-c peroxidase n=1 Tax=Trichloromonas sp. TaxID=3069249 RepID=UPI003D81B12F
MIRNAAYCLTLMTLTVNLAWAGPGLPEQSKAFFQPVPSAPPQLAGNPSSPEKLLLGRMLYFEPRLSASSLISCQTCHNVGLAGADMQETSVGHGWQKGPRNAPTTLNAVFNQAQFWDGRAKDLAEQAKGPVQASVEMNNTPEQVLATLRSLPEYVELFKKAFPQDQQPLTFDNMARAIEVFEATLLTPDAPFDRFLNGDVAALTDTEKTGLSLFIDKGCVGCHSGTNIGGSGYFPFGVVEKPSSDILPLDDTGRFKVTNVAADEYAFRSPSLRNVALTPPYFHSGKVWKLLDSVRIMGAAQLGITLTGGEAEQITAFLKTLTGEQPRVEHPILPPQQDDTPRPVLTGTGS